MVVLLLSHFIRVREYIRIAFEEDVDLLEKYHIVNDGTLDECVEDTWKRIAEVNARESLTYFSVVQDGITIGFSVIGPSFLLSFGINIKYRTKEVLGSWWEAICKLLGYEFVTWIFKKNSRTLNFLLRNGMTISEVVEAEEYYNLVYIKS